MIRLINSISIFLVIRCVGGFGPITLGHQSLQLHASGDVDASPANLGPLVNFAGRRTARAAVALIEALPSDERNRIEDMVRERSEARWRGDFAAADKLRDAIDNIRVALPSTRILQHINVTDAASNWDIDVEYKVAVADVPRSKGGRSEWELVPIGSPSLSGNGDVQNEDNILQLAHAALGLAVSASERDVDVDQSVLNELIGRAEDRLHTLKERKAICHIFLNTAAAAGELHGRKAADAILWFALAGVTSKHCNLFNDLVGICTDELQRFGRNASCRAKDVLHIAERVAMAGVVGDPATRLYEVAASCLKAKMQTADDGSSGGEDGGIDYRSIIQSLRDGSFGLHSDRPLLGLWRFSTRQRKQRSFLRNAACHFDGKFGDDCTEMNLAPPKQNQYDWPAMFADPSRPLIVDVGCGFGVSTLGLASMGDSSIRPGANEIQIDWGNCNYIGVDISRVAIGYARGVSERQALGDLTFVVDSAEKCLGRIRESYPGQVALIMAQFPTPYRFEGIEEEDGTGSPSSVAKGYNSQLPEGAASDSFMVTENLLSLAQSILAKDHGQLLIQSNCEDVAVHMKNTASMVGFHPVSFTHSVNTLDAVTQRAQRWMEMGSERAIGQHWSAEPLLPSIGRTETEVACSLDDKPVHRCLLTAEKAST